MNVTKFLNTAVIAIIGLGIISITIISIASLKENEMYKTKANSLSPAILPENSSAALPAITPSSGKLTISEGKMYYYENGIAKTGLIEITNGNNRYYYIDGERPLLMNYTSPIQEGLFNTLSENTSSPLINVYESYYNLVRENTDENVIYYFQEDGSAFTNGLILIDASGKACNPDKDDCKTTNIYYFEEDGRAFTDGLLPVELDGNTSYYFFGNDGKAITNAWQNIEDITYYFGEDGKRVSDVTMVLDGNQYHFDKTGKLYSGWLEENGSWNFYDYESYQLTYQGNELIYEAWQKGINEESETDYMILTDTEKFRVFVFTGKAGNWSPVQEFVCAPGLPETPSRKGKFKVGLKGYSFGKGFTCYYYTQYSGDYLFHSITYYQGTMRIQDPTMGAPASHGCIRMDINDAKWIYENVPVGSFVWVY
ncbi:MAG: L,D-transpeptidase family protein [Wujia sp.]